MQQIRCSTHNILPIVPRVLHQMIEHFCPLLSDKVTHLTRVEELL